MVTSSGMKILICRHVIRHETSRQDMTCADRSIVIWFFLLLFATGERLGTVRDCLIWCTGTQATVSPDGMNLEYQHKIGLLWKSYVLKGRRSRNLP